MKRYYINKADINDAIRIITARQAQRNEYANITVKEYRGNAYDKETTVVLCVG